MLKVMAKPLHAPTKTLGVGKYYERSQEALSELQDWIPVRLERPLLLDERKVHALEQEYATKSEDPAVAMSGAWKLRRDIMQRGYDSIIAIDASQRLKIVHLCGAMAERSSPATAKAGGVVTMIRRTTSAGTASVEQTGWPSPATSTRLFRPEIGSERDRAERAHRSTGRTTESLR